MALSRDFVGREYRLDRPYEVGAEKVREFAQAIGETSPLCFDEAAARAAGYPSLVAPVTFAFTLTMKLMNQIMADPELGLDYSRLVHGEQRFSYDRPILAGDAVSVASTLHSIEARGRNEVLTLQSELTTTRGIRIGRTTEVIVSRGTAEES